MPPKLGLEPEVLDMTTIAEMTKGTVCVAIAAAVDDRHFDAESIICGLDHLLHAVLQELNKAMLGIYLSAPLPGTSSERRGMMACALGSLCWTGNTQFCQFCLARMSAPSADSSTIVEFCREAMITARSGVSIRTRLKPAMTATGIQPPSAILERRNMSLQRFCTLK